MLQLTKNTPLRRRKVDLQLINDEKIVKEWEFSSEQVTSITNLVVTNKRVVINSQGRTKERATVVRNEIGLESIKGVSTSYSFTKTVVKGLFVLGIIFIALAVLFFALAIPAKEEDITTYLALFVLCLIVGIILLFFKKIEMVFILSIATSPLVATLNVVNNPLCVLDTKNNATSVLYVAISEEKAKEIIDTIGAVILQK